MLNSYSFYFSVVVEEPVVRLSPQNYITEIDAVSSLFGLERFQGEHYADFFWPLQQLSKDGFNRNDIAIIQSTRSSFLPIEFGSKDNTSFRYKISVSGNKKFTIREEFKLTSQTWSYREEEYDLLNYKLYPFLFVFLEKLKVDFPNLYISNQESYYQLRPDSFFPNQKNYKRGYTSSENLYINIENKNILPLSISLRFNQNNSLIEKTQVDLEASLSGTYDFFIDYDNARCVFKDKEILKLLPELEYFEIDINSVFVASYCLVDSFSNQDLFERWIDNSSSKIAEENTEYNETPKFLKVFNGMLNDSPNFKYRR